jgi:hypothetical protein
LRQRNPHFGSPSDRRHKPHCCGAKARGNALFWCEFSAGSNQNAVEIVASRPAKAKIE